MTHVKTYSLPRCVYANLLQVCVGYAWFTPLLFFLWNPLFFHVDMIKQMSLCFVCVYELVWFSETTCGRQALSRMCSDIWMHTLTSLCAFGYWPRFHVFRAAISQRDILTCCYLQNLSKDWQGLSSITEIAIIQSNHWPIGQGPAECAKRLNFN